MSQNQNRQNTRNTTILLLLFSIVGALVSLLANVASSELPDYLKTHPVLTWLLFIICLVVSIALSIKLHHIGQNTTSSVQSSGPSTPGSPPPSFNRQVNPSAMPDSSPGTLYRPLESLDIPTTQLDSAQIEPPHFWDEDDIDEHQNIDKPLPQKPLKIPEVSVQEKILSLRPLQAQSEIRKKLIEQPKMLYWSPSADTLACVFYEKISLFIINEERLVDLSFSGSIDAMCWSPDGSTIAISSEGKIHFWDTLRLVEHMQLQPLHTYAQHIYGVDWSREKLAIWEGTDIRLCMFSDVEVYQNLSTKEQDLTCTKPGLLRWSPSGSWLVAGASNGMLVCWNVDTKIQKLLSSNRRWRIYTLTWFPHSSNLAVVFLDRLSGDRRIVIWDVEKEQEIAPPLERLPVLPLSLSASTKRRLVIASDEQELLLSGSNDLFLTDRYPGQLLAAWSPRNSQLATLHPQDPTTLVIVDGLSE